MMRRLIVQVGCVLFMAFVMGVATTAAPTFWLLGALGQDGGIRIEGMGHTNPYDPDGFPALDVRIADTDEPYLLYERNRTGTGIHTTWIGNDGNTYDYANNGRQVSGGVGGVLLGAANIYPGYGVSVLATAGEAGVFTDGALHVRDASNSVARPIEASSVTLSDAAGVGLRPACFTAVGTLVPCP